MLVQIITGTTRDGRFSEKVASWVTGEPISFVGWGNVGGARAIEQLREVAVEFEMAPLRHAVHILPDVMIPILRGEDPNDLSPLQSLGPKLDLLVDDLSWWTNALGAARAKDAA